VGFWVLGLGLGRYIDLQLTFFFFFIIEKAMQLQCIINETNAASDIPETSLNNIHNNSNKAGIRYIGKSFKTLPNNVTPTMFQTAIETHFGRIGEPFVDTASVKCFGKIVKGGKNLFSTHHISKSKQRNSRSVSKCLVLLNEK
jgi:hypothetical protein